MGASVSQLYIALGDEVDTGSSNTDTTTTTTGSSSCYGQHELVPIMAGSTLRGSVMVVISKSFRVPSTTATPILVQLHLYGKEKIQINSHYPVQRQHPNHSTTVTTTTTTTTTTNSSNIISSLVSNQQQQQQQMEYEFLNIPLQWDDFPTIIHKSKTNMKKIRKGTYTFPFQIQLPNHIPSSMYHPSNSSSGSGSGSSNKNKSCRIQYKLRASIYFPKQQGRNNPSQLSSTTKTSQQQRRADYTTTRYIWVAATSTRSSRTTRTTPQENPEFEPVPCMVASIVMYLGCRPHRNKKGEFFMFGASIDNTRISKNIHGMNHPGQRATTTNNIALQISCRNNTSVAIQKVRVSFIERISWNTAPIQCIHPQTGICTTTSPMLQQSQEIPISTWDNIQLPTGFAKEYKGFIQSTIETLFGTATNNNNGYNKNQLQQFQREIYNDLVSRNNLIELNLLPTTTTANNNMLCVGPNHTIVTMDDNNTNNGTTTATTTTTTSSSTNQQTHTTTTSLTRETYSGRLIQITHFIRIVFVTAGMNNTNFYFHPNRTPVLEIPIQIVPPPSSTTTTASSQSAQGTDSPSVAVSSSSCAYPASYQPPKDSASTSSSSSSVLTTTAITGLAATNMNHTINGNHHATTTSTHTTSNTPDPTNTANNNHTNDTTIPMATAVVLSNDFTTTTTDTGSESASNVIVLNEDSIIQQQPATAPNKIHPINNGRRRGGFWNRQNQKHPSLVQQQQRTSPASNLQDATSRPDATAAPSLSNLVPVPLPTKEFENTISIPALINSMRSSMNGYEYLHSKLCDPLYIDLFQHMSCHEYGTIVGTVQPFDQPRVAVLLAPFVNYTNGGLTCTYAACAIQNSHDHHRAITAQKLIPLCIDIEDHSMILLNELNGWEQTIVERTLADAIK